MELRAGFERLAGWGGWRRYSPAAGSVGAHLLAGAALAVILADVSRAERMGVEHGMEVTLVAIADPASPVPATPSPPPVAKTTAEPILAPVAEADAPAPVSEPSASQNDRYSAGTPPARSGTALGLRSLLESDPCHPPGGGRRRGDCSWDWVTLTERGDPTVTPSLQRLAELYPGYRLPGREPARPAAPASPVAPAVDD